MASYLITRWLAPVIIGGVALGAVGCGSTPVAAGHAPQPTVHIVHRVQAKASHSGPVPVYQEYTFGPGYGQHVSAREKNRLQRLVNQLGNPPHNAITLNGFEAGYQHNGALSVLLFVRNGYDYPIWGISGRIRLEEHHQILAAADFTFSPTQFGTLDPGVSEIWEITFQPSQVYVQHATLHTYQLVSDLTFSH